MNDFLQQLHDLVPTFNVASIPKDSTGVFASPVHIVAGLLNLKLETIKKLPEISDNVNLNCTRMKVIDKGTEQRNKIMVGTVVSIMRVLASSKRPDITAIVARLPAIAPVPQASVPMETPVQQAPFDAMDVDGASANDLQDNGDQAIQDHFDFVPAQMVEFVLELNNSKFNIPVRRDGYVNVTKICQAAGKRLDHYKESPAGKEYMEFLQNRNLAKSNTRNPGITLLTSMRGNCPGRGTFAHPDLAMAIAMWAHPPFLAEVSGWIWELLITGRVELGKEKTPEELDAILNRRIAEEQAKIQADYLREKLSKDLLAIDEDIAAKRANHQRDDAAAEKERVAKRAKHQRNDAVADDKAKEESRMQLVRFDAEIAANAIATAEDLKLKRLKVNECQSNCAKNLIDLQANFMPKLICLYVNARLRSAMNDIEVNLAHKINKCLIGDDCKASGEASGEASGYQETLYCNDFQTFLREMGFPMATTSQLSALGAFVSKKYKEANINKPEKTMKIVNNTYKIKHKDFIEKCIREYYGQSTDVPIAKPPGYYSSLYQKYQKLQLLD